MGCGLMLGSGARRRSVEWHGEVSCWACGGGSWNDTCAEMGVECDVAVVVMGLIDVDWCWSWMVHLMILGAHQLVS